LLNKTDVHAIHAKPLSARKKAPDEVYFANGLRKAARNNQQRPSIIFPSTLSHKTGPPQSMAVRFALEMNDPAYIRFTGELPFGVHAWGLHDRKFWAGVFYRIDLIRSPAELPI